MKVNLNLWIYLFFSTLHLSYHTVFYHEHKGFIWCVSVDIIVEVLQSFIEKNFQQE